MKVAVLVSMKQTVPYITILASLFSIYQYGTILV